MHITIFGSGYVGLVTGACMAEMGNHVVCVDIDEDKILSQLVHRRTKTALLICSTYWPLPIRLART